MDPRTISDLLAHRDGELADPDTIARIEGDPEARAELVRLRRMREELRALPPVAPDPAVWAAVRERTGRGRSPWLQRFPLATAATVFVAAALAIMVWDPTVDDNPAAPLEPQVSDPVAQLMVRSQRLESELLSRASAPGLIATTSEQALLFGIADVDAQLNELYESETPDLEERERLWRQRVVLLESLTNVQRGQAVLRPAVY